MTQLIDETRLFPGGMADLESYDALERERAARAAAEQTAADLAELIARENARAAEASTKLGDVQALLELQTQRADRLERELAQAGFYQRDELPMTRWQAVREAWRNPNG